MFLHQPPARHPLMFRRPCIFIDVVHAATVCLYLLLRAPSRVATLQNCVVLFKTVVSVELLIRIHSSSSSSFLVFFFK